METTHSIELNEIENKQKDSEGVSSIEKDKKKPDSNNIEHPLIDVVKSLENGEFGPFILALLHEYIPIDFLTSEGYNILHQATAFNAKEIIYLLVEKLSIPLDILSQTKQTSLMIASNFGFIELMKYFLDHGANLSLTDECNFNPLLYAAKQGELTSIIYLLHRGSDIMIKDNNGCDLVHWAAFKNNVFLLRLFKRFNLPLNEMDFHGFKPIDRAVANSSFESVKFFLDNVLEGINVASMNFLDIKNEEIKNYMLEKIQQGKRRRDKIKKTLENYRRLLVFCGYAGWMVLMIWNFSDNNKFNDHFYSIVVILGLWVYLICYIFLFLKKGEEKNDDNKKNNELLTGLDPFYDTIQKIKKEDLFPFSFFHLDNLIYHDSAPNLQQYTILHYIAYLIDSYRFLDILDIDYKRVCPMCLIYKPPKTKHCSICNKCVDFYHHHSIIFNRCFNSKNHIFYIGLLFLQQIITSVFLKVMFSAYYDDCQSWVTLIIPETFYLINKERGYFWSMNFLLNFVIWCYNSGFLMIELYGIMKNLSYNEIMNRQRYRYLFRKEKNSKGKVMYIFGKGNSFGIYSNIKNYIYRYFNS